MILFWLAAESRGNQAEFSLPGPPERGHCGHMKPSSCEVLVQIERSKPLGGGFHCFFSVSTIYFAGKQCFQHVNVDIFNVIRSILYVFKSVDKLTSVLLASATTESVHQLAAWVLIKLGSEPSP